MGTGSAIAHRAVGAVMGPTGGSSEAGWFIENKYATDDEYPPPSSLLPPPFSPSSSSSSSSSSSCCSSARQ